MAEVVNTLSEQPAVIEEYDMANGAIEKTDHQVVVGTTQKPVGESENPGLQTSGEELKQGNDKYSWQVNLQVCFLVGYYIILLFFFLWLLFDFWSNSFSFAALIGIKVYSLEDSALQFLRTIGFTIIGGCLGNILYRVRQLHNHYCKGHYNHRWVGKYISEPWESAAMAMVVLALIHGGIALFTGSVSADVSGVNNFTTFGTGALVGFGMNKVVKWLDQLVANTFKGESEKDPVKI